jgi:nucleoside-diphosphate kinase
MALERSLVLVKPDGVERRLVGEVLRRFETRGLRLVGLKLLVPPRELAEQHYAIHRDKPFFRELVDFITSGPVVAMAWEADDCITMIRTMMGPTNAVNAAPGTLRGDFCTEIQRNLVHGSDAPETAKTELALWFAPGELL